MLCVCMQGNWRMYLNMYVCTSRSVHSKLLIFSMALYIFCPNLQILLHLAYGVQKISENAKVTRKTGLTKIIYFKSVRVSVKELLKFRDLHITKDTQMGLKFMTIFSTFVRLNLHVRVYTYIIAYLNSTTLDTNYM